MTSIIINKYFSFKRWCRETPAPPAYRLTKLFCINNYFSNSNIDIVFIYFVEIDEEEEWIKQSLLIEKFDQKANVHTYVTDDFRPNGRRPSA